MWKEQLYQYPGWVRIRTILDSGAAQSIAPPSMAKGVPVRPSEMSSQGRSYTSADGGRIENKGQQVLHVTTNEGRQGMTRCQVGDVNRPLMAVSQIADAGNILQFASDGGWIYNLTDESYTRFERHNNIFEFNMWLNASDANGPIQEANGQPGFTWPGR